jgi:site-specific DNA recombinase
LKEQRDEALSITRGSDALKERMHEMIDYLKNQSNRVTDYDEQMVRKLIEKIEVYDDHLVFLFKSGIQFEIKG